MQTIRYIFSDGTTSEIEVTDELYTMHLEIVQQERRLYWRESRRQTSLENLTEQGIDFADTAANPLADYIRKENTEQIRKAIAALLPEQQALIKQIFYEGKTITEIAKAEKVGKSAIANRLTRIYAKLKKFFD